MDTLEGLKKKIKTANELHSVVKTMKVLAAVNIRQYEKAVNSLKDYYRTIELGLQVVLQQGYRISANPGKSTERELGVIIWGTDQGMCGQLNEHILTHATDNMKRFQTDVGKRTSLAVGIRVANRLQDSGENVEKSYDVPGSASNITAAVHELLMKIEDWNSKRGITDIVLFYNRYVPASNSYEPQTFYLLPFYPEHFSHLLHGEWPSRVIPFFSMDTGSLFSSLVREFLFVSLYRAFAESLASENASRLMSMQKAEKNISDRLTDLNYRFNQQRQTSITEELLDLVSGYEAQKKKQ